MARAPFISWADCNVNKASAEAGPVKTLRLLEVGGGKARLPLVVGGIVTPRKNPLPPSLSLPFVQPGWHCPSACRGGRGVPLPKLAVFSSGLRGQGKRDTFS